MPSYKITQETPVAGGTFYDVVLCADDGREEAQRYFVREGQDPAVVLSKAAWHFQDGAAVEEAPAAPADEPESTPALPKEQL